MELQKNKYILFKFKGLALIKEITETNITVSFSNGQTGEFIKDENGRFYNLIPDDEIEYIKDYCENSNFQPLIKERGEEYANLNHLRNFTYDERTCSFNCEAVGTDIYKVSLYARTQIARCTCPYKHNCKHEYALLFYLYNEILKLEDFIEKDFNIDYTKKPESILHPEIYEYADQFIETYLDFEIGYKLYKNLKKVINPSELQDFANYYFNKDYENDLVLEGLFDIFALSRSNLYLNPYIKSIQNPTDLVIVTKEYNLIKNYDEFSYNESLISSQFTTYKYLFNNKIEKLFNIFNYKKGMLRSEFYTQNIMTMATFLKSKNRSLVNLFNAYVSGVSIKEINKNNVLALYNMLDEYEKDITISYLPEEFLYLIDDDTLIKSLNQTSNAKKVVKYLLDKIENDAEEVKLSYFFNILYYVKGNLPPRIPYQLLIKFYKANFNESHFLEDYINSDARINEFGYGQYYDEINVDQINPKINLMIDLNNFNDFFKMSGHISIIRFIEETNEVVYKKKFLLKDYNDHILIKLVFDSSHTYDDEVQVEYDYVDKNYKNKYAQFLYNYVTKYDESYIKEQEEFEDRVNEFKATERDRRAISVFKSIANLNLMKATKKLNEEALIHLDYYIDVIKNGNYKANFLSLKIGNKKPYIVKSLYEFTRRFENNEYFQYGKELGFLHNVKNFILEDRAPINYLCGLHFETKSSKTTELTTVQLNNLLELLKGRTVYFNNVPYLIRLDEKEYNYTIDKNYTLEVNKDPNEDVYLSDNHTYVFNKKTRIVDHYVDDKGKLELLDFVIKNKGYSLKNVKKEFNEEVYPIFKDVITVSPEINDDFKLSELVIESYFGLEKNPTIIKLETKYIKDDVEINKEDINTSNDEARIYQYNKLLLDLGVDENNEIKNSTDILNFFSVDFSEIKKITKVFIDEELDKMRLTKFQPPTIKLSYDKKTNLMNVTLEGDEFSEEELKSILDSLKNKKKFVLLKGNRIVRLDDEKAANFYEAINDLNLDLKKFSKTEYKPIYQTLAAFSHLDNVEMDSYLKKMIKDIKGFKKANFKLPELNCELREYQKEGFNWLKILTSYNLGGILADDMGLGKTLQVITLFASDETNKPSLIVAPKSLVFNWINEFQKFAPSIKLKTIYGTSEERTKILNSINENEKVVYFTSYDSLRNDIDNYKMNFNFLILDEAQYIKNVYALKTITIKQVKAEHRFALTGTPIENDIFDLWSIFDFLMPNYLNNLYSFKKNIKDEEYEKKVIKRVTPFILRRTKAEVLNDLPEKFERVITSKMTEEQRKIYEAYKLNARTILNGEDNNKLAVLQLLTRLRQISVSPATFIDDYKGGSGKLELLDELLDDYIKDGHRILIFSQFVSALELVEERLVKKKIKYFKITGKTGSAERISMVDEFNKNEEYKIFLISLKAGGNGLNLVGSDTVIHLDPWWNIAAENQASDRAYRIGQTRNVEVIKLISEDSIEQGVIELQNAKKELADKFINDDTSLIEKITFDDLKFILK